MAYFKTTGRNRERDIRQQARQLVGFRCGGFTLLEFMVTLSVASLLVVAAAPTFQETIRENRMRAAVSQLEGALNLARMEAMRRNHQVSVCASANPNVASPVCKTDSSGWESGWIVFADQNANVQLDGNTNLIRVYDGVEDGITARRNGTASTHANRVLFRPSGALVALNNGTFIICDVRGVERATRMAVSTIGRIFVSDADPNNDSCPGP